MGIFSKLFKGPEIDMEKSDANAKKMRALFNQVVENGKDYQLIFGYTEDVSRFNYGFVHGSKTKIGNPIVVAIEDSVQHKLYKKIVKRTYKLKAHDENNECRVGDRVRIMETRPLSKDKRWRLVEIIEKAK